MDLLQKKAGKQFFFEKKNQKTFVPEAPNVLHAQCQTGESLFASSSEKEEFFLPFFITERSATTDRRFGPLARGRSCMRSVLALAVGLGAAGLAGPALAHAFLQSATPAVGSTVAAPSEVEITFTEGVEPRFSSIAVQDAAGGSVTAGTVHPAGGAARLAVALKPLPPGTYQVSWHATAVDTHRTEGSFRFTVRP